MVSAFMKRRSRSVATGCPGYIPVAGYVHCSAGREGTRDLQNHLNSEKFLTGNMGLKNEFPGSFEIVVSGDIVEVGTGVGVLVIGYFVGIVILPEYFIGAEVGITPGALLNHGVKNDCSSDGESVGRGVGVGVAVGVGGGVGVGVPVGGSR